MDLLDAAAFMFVVEACCGSPALRRELDTIVSRFGVKKNPTLVQYLRRRYGLYAEEDVDALRKKRKVPIALTPPVYAGLRAILQDLPALSHRLELACAISEDGSEGGVLAPPGYTTNGMLSHPAPATAAQKCDTGIVNVRFRPRDVVSVLFTADLTVACTESTPNPLLFTGEAGAWLSHPPVELPGHSGAAMSASILPKSRAILTAAQDGHVRLFARGSSGDYQYRSGYQIAHAGTSHLPCWQVAGNPTDDIFAVAGAAEAILVCNAETGARLSRHLTKSNLYPSNVDFVELVGHLQQGVDLLQWHPMHPSLLFSASASDHTARGWDIRAPKRPTATFHSPRAYISSMAVTVAPAPQLALGTSEGSAVMWDVRHPRLVPPSVDLGEIAMLKERLPVYALTFDKAGTLYAGYGSSVLALPPTFGTKSADVGSYTALRTDARFGRIVAAAYVASDATNNGFVLTAQA